MVSIDKQEQVRAMVNSMKDKVNKTIKYRENFMQSLHLVFVLIKCLLKLLTFFVKIDENDQNAYVNIFQGTIDMIVIPLGPLLTQISWP